MNPGLVMELLAEISESADDVGARIVRAEIDAGVHEVGFKVSSTCPNTTAIRLSEKRPRATFVRSTLTLAGEEQGVKFMVCFS